MAKKKSKAKNKDSNRCTARVKTCPNKSCRHKYKAGDKSWNCPKCGHDRRCVNKAKEGYDVCRVHGAGGGRPPVHGKYIIPPQIEPAFNRVVNQDDLLSLATTQAVLEARTNQLLDMISHYNPAGAHRDIMAAIYRIENALKPPTKKDGPPFDYVEAQRGLAQLRKAIDPVRIEYQLWEDVKSNLELTRRINDTERKHLAAMDQLVAIGQVHEVIRIIARMALKYILQAQDRKSFTDEMRMFTARKES